MNKLFWHKLYIYAFLDGNFLSHVVNFGNFMAGNFLGGHFLGGYHIHLYICMKINIYIYSFVHLYWWEYEQNMRSFLSFAMEKSLTVNALGISNKCCLFLTANIHFVTLVWHFSFWNDFRQRGVCFGISICSPESVTEVETYIL